MCEQTGIASYLVRRQTGTVIASALSLNAELSTTSTLLQCLKCVYHREHVHSPPMQSMFDTEHSRRWMSACRVERVLFVGEMLARRGLSKQSSTPG